MSYTVLLGNSCIYKNKGTSVWNFVPKSGLRKVRDGTSVVETYYGLRSTMVDAESVINWTVVDQLRCANITSSIRPEVHTVSKRRQRKTEP